MATINTQLEKTFWADFKQSNSLMARDTLFYHYFEKLTKPVVLSILRRFSKRNPDIVSDLLQEGALEQLIRMEKFDVSLNIKFETYARPRIAGAIKEICRKPFRRRSRKIELERPEENLKDKSLLPDQYLAKEDAREYLLGRLGDLQRQVVSLYYFNGLTMDEVGEMLGYAGNSRPSQLHQGALERLRLKLSAEKVRFLLAG